MKPFLKWAGNKFQIIERIKALLPEGNRLIEPFVGSGAVFLNTAYSSYLLADANPDLISLYRFLKEEGSSFIEECRSFFIPENNERECYLKLRAHFNQTTLLRERAVLFVYLNKHSFNGLCRYNSKGVFNVPFGKYVKPYFPVREMQDFSEKSQNATFVHQDFRECMLSAHAGDVVYCDPPYVPASETANFTAYAAGGFGMKEQLELATLAQELAKKGVQVLLSNHNTEFTRSLYAQAARREWFSVQRFISCHGQNRTKAEEVLALFN